MCRFGLCSRSSGLPHKKPTTLMATHPAFGDVLRRDCEGDHEHAPTAGSDTRKTGEYTTKFCKAVVKGFQIMLRSSHEAYPVSMPPGAEEFDYDIEEDFKDLMAPAVAADMELDEGADPSIAPEEEPGAGKGEEGQPLLEGAAGIEVPAHVGKHEAKALRRLHQNLGHPSPEDLARHLKLSGAREDMVKAAKQLRCATCARHPRPYPRRPAKTMRSMDFNQEVGVDIISLYTPGKKKISAMSVVDYGSGYHLVRRIEGKKSADYVKTFTEMWLSWAGVAQRIVVDQERGLTKDFADEMERKGACLHYVAGQAHWQSLGVKRRPLLTMCT